MICLYCLPIAIKYLDDQIYRLLADTKGKLGELKGATRLIPNQGMLINSLTLQEAQASSEIENIFTTNDELYAAFSNPEHIEGPAKEVLLKFSEKVTIQVVKFFSFRWSLSLQNRLDMNMDNDG